jgi:hypothetical protein
VALKEKMRKIVLTAALLALVVGVVGLQVATAAPKPKTVTIDRARPNPVVFGRTVALSGRLTGSGHAGKTIQVQADEFPYEGSFKNVATPTTNTAGKWAATDKPTVNTRYRARQGSTISGIVTEGVRIRVSLRVSDRTPASGQRVRFRGRACPEHDGARVRIQRRTASGKWRTRRRTTLRDIPGSTCSRYSRRFRVFSDGTYRAVVVSPDRDHRNGISRRRHLDAH